MGFFCSCISGLRSQSLGNFYCLWCNSFNSRLWHNLSHISHIMFSPWR